MVFSFVRMFPKEEKMRDYKTGGFLIEHINTSTFLLILLFFIFLFFPGLIIFLFRPLLIGLPF
ncbi:MAG: hypothetical protein ACFFBV_02965, partial [Promethearchaeota archaeon]